MFVRIAVLATSLFIAVVLSSGIPSYAEEGVKFTNPTLGFEITKPSDWHFMTDQQNRENLEATEFKSQDFKELILKHSSVPLLVIAKHQEPFDDLNPSLKVNTRLFGDLKGTKAVSLISLIVPQFQKAFLDFEMVQEPKEVELAGLTAGYARFNYSLAIPDGRTFPTTSELWIIPKGDYFYMIGAGTRQDEETGTRAEVKAILDSMKIVE